jgi:cytochrome c556
MRLALTTSLIVLTLGTTAFISGCNQPAPKAVTASAPVAVAITTPKPVFSINELMVMMVDQPGELLWDVEKKGHAPKTDEAWYQLENHAVAVSAAGNLIQLGGTGPSDAGWAGQPQWQAHAQQLIDAGLTARKAAKGHDLPSLIAANGQIVDACEACHKEFKPDLPTGGLFMHHVPGTH